MPGGTGPVFLATKPTAGKRGPMLFFSNVRTALLSGAVAVLAAPLVLCSTVSAQISFTDVAAAAKVDRAGEIAEQQLRAFREPGYRIAELRARQASTVDLVAQARAVGAGRCEQDLHIGPGESGAAAHEAVVRVEEPSAV